MEVNSSSLIQLENHRAIVVIDPFGGAITDFRLKTIGINPLCFVFTKAQMPLINRNGAVYQGHFLCLGRWGEASAGEQQAGVPNHGQFANMTWNVAENKEPNAARMNATGLLEGLHIERKIILDMDSPVYVAEVVQNINPLGRLYNMVQHPTLAAPFLNESTIVDCNATQGFDQAFYQEVNSHVLQWPIAKDRDHETDLRNPATPYNGVFCFVIEPGAEYGWITAFSPEHRLMIGYTWKRREYPWIHLWQHFSAGVIQYRGIEFGTAGIHQPFNEILNTSTILFGEKTTAFIDAGEYISKKYLSFIHHTEDNFAGVKDITVVNDHLQITGRNGTNINIKLSKEVFNELSE
ncbi:MAG: hypothetical protein WKI04_00355 [Ferruginibacter sp.]